MMKLNKKKILFMMIAFSFFSLIGDAPVFGPKIPDDVQSSIDRYEEILPIVETQGINALSPEDQEIYMLAQPSHRTSDLKLSV